MSSLTFLNMTSVSQKAISGGLVEDWTNLGGRFRGIPQSLYYSSFLLAFTQNADNNVGMCKVSGTTASWSSWGGSLAAPPGVAPSPNGAVAVAGRMQDGEIFLSYINPSQETYTAWTELANGTPSGVTWAGNPVLATNVSNGVDAFSLDSSGALWCTWQTSTTNPITWADWTSLGTPSGTSFETNATFTAYLLPSDGSVHVVALGTDGQMYESSLNTGDGVDSATASWSAVGQGGQTVSLINGAASSYCESVSGPIYAAYNNLNRQNNNPLVFCAPPQFSTWGNLNLTQEQFPVSTAAPVMVSNFGIPQIAWLSQNTPGQMMFVSQSNSVGFWQPVVPLGAANSQLTGQMSGFAEGGNVALFQLGLDAELYYVNYMPDQVARKTSVDLAGTSSGTQASN